MEYQFLFRKNRGKILIATTLFLLLWKQERPEISGLLFASCL